MTSTTTQRILALVDAGETDAAAIAKALTCSPGYVYRVLRSERPDRERKPHRRWSNMPEQIRALFKVNKDAARTAKLLKCSTAYVYRHVGDLM